MEIWWSMKIIKKRPQGTHIDGPISTTAGDKWQYTYLFALFLHCQGTLGKARKMK
jgi:hypothetical protein